MADTPDWDAINAGPTPSLDEYAALEKADPNAFWRLDSGHHQNLLDEALAEVERLSGECIHLRELRVCQEDLENAQMGRDEARAEVALVRGLCDDAVRLADDRWREKAALTAIVAQQQKREARVRAHAEEWREAWADVATSTAEPDIMRQIALAWLSARGIVLAALDGGDA